MIDREFGLTQDVSLFVMVGRIARWKGQHVFIQAAARAYTQNSQTRFLIVGGPVTEDDVRFDKECRALVTEKNLEAVILFAGAREDPRPFYAASVGLVLASVRPEPLGLVVLEAMAAARPVIVTAQGGPLELVVDQQTGWLVPPNEVEALAQTMLTLVAQPDVAQQRGAAGRTRCRQHFTHVHTLAGVLKVYADILQRKDIVLSVAGML
jgi:glycosyltransferase involved in cell wall biosynthesis